VSKILIEKFIKPKALPKEFAQSFASILEQHPAFESEKDWLSVSDLTYLDQFKKKGIRSITSHSKQLH
jgi:hypothetical protein